MPHEPPLDLDCRVAKPNSCQSLGANKWGRGFHVENKYKDIRSYHNGLQIYRPEDGLTIYQRKDYLTPEYFDGGCFEWTCPQKRLCPHGALAGPTLPETKMYDHLFASTDPYVLNGGPPQCAGIKGDSANSYLGWTIPPDQHTPLWMSIAGQAGDVSSCRP
jgi:hypothetical protein